MEVDGFDLELNDYCEYCGCFYPQVEQTECTMICDKSKRYLNVIHCKNRDKCAKIAENLKYRINGKIEQKNRDISSIEDVIHFFEGEISQTQGWLNSESLSPAFNGVDVGFKEAKQLKECHIRYCQNIIDRIRSDRL